VESDTKAGEIIVQAFRDGNFLTERDSTAEDMLEALPRLNSMIFSLLGLELGEQYRDWPVPFFRTSSVASRYPLGPLAHDLTPDQWTNPPVNVRIMASITAPATVYFPNNPSDGARMAYADAGATALLTFDGNGRLIQGQPTIQGVGGSRRWLYRADDANWVCLEKLGMDDRMPLPPEFDELFINGLIIKLSTRFKTTVSDDVRMGYADMLSRLKKRYKQSEEIPAAGYGDFAGAGVSNIRTGL
jgi:hypothetical protein